MIHILLVTVAVLFGLGVVFSFALYFVAAKFRVDEDPRIDEIEKVMPGANCGGCGFAGCRDFAQNCVRSGSLDNLFCPVGGNATMKKVAAVLGVDVADKAPAVAVLKCNGSCQNRPKVNEYDGYRSCRVESMLYKGETACPYGCLGCGDCRDACRFGAISIDSVTGLPVVNQEKCVGCGACAEACPKSLIELRAKGPRGMRVYVACSNKDKGAVSRKACSASCIGCGKCAKVCPHEAITISDNLAYIDFKKCRLCRKCEAQCPQGAIHSVNFPQLKTQEEKQ